MEWTTYSVLNKEIYQKKPHQEIGEAFFIETFVYLLQNVEGYSELNGLLIV